MGSKINQTTDKKSIIGFQKNYYFIDIAKDAYNQHAIVNSFTFFNSINNIFYLIYANINKSIIFFDILNNKKIAEIKRAHKDYVTSFRHYSDIINKRDLIISICRDDNNIKLWDVYNLECLLNLDNVNNDGSLNSACFLNDNNQIYIISSNYRIGYKSEPIKIYDINGNIIKEINNSNEIEDDVNIIDFYYDNQLSKNYIICGTNYYVKSYDYNKNEVYHIYQDEDYFSHSYIAINKKQKIIELIESSEKNIRIWNFHSAELLNIITPNISPKGLCLFNNIYLLVYSDNKEINIIDLEKNMVVDIISTDGKDIISMKRLIHPIYGECLISQGYSRYYENGIKLWIKKNN